MLAGSPRILVEWGDCDPAAIVFFPRYLEFFDACTWALLTSALGLRKSALIERWGIAGCPVVDLRTRFLLPSTYGDEVTVETQVHALRRGRFEVRHRLLNAGRLAVECLETRVWAGPDPDNPKTLRSRPIPEAVREVLSRKAD